jgi:chitinase
MFKSGYSFLAVLTLLWAATAGLAQANFPPTDATADTQVPVEVEDTFLQTSGVRTHFEASNKMSELANQLLAQDRIVSIPHFSGSFLFQGKTFPFTIVGRAPQKAQTTRIPTVIIPISLYFEGYVDQQGNPIVMDISPKLPSVVNSPNFRNASYPGGYTQFGDAVQRAQFFHAMSADWHTILEEPRVLRPVNIDVPRGSATLYHMRSSGAVFAVVDEGFFISHLNTIIQLENLNVNALPIAVSANVFLSPGGDIRKCCVLGFHTSFDAGDRDELQLVQTFVWASWIDAGIFGSTVADVTAISHEISEWLNDPFSSNIVPDWQFPNAGGGCQNNMETGDPISAFQHAGFPVIIDGFTYHPQNETLLQWFERKTPSDAIDRAYSFPDENLLISPSQPCNTQ